MNRASAKRLAARAHDCSRSAARESGLHRKSIERLVKKYQLDAKGMKPR